MRRPDFAAGIVLAGVGLYVIRQSSLLTYRDEFGPGPGLLPFWLGVFLTGLALCVALFSLRGGSSEVTAAPLSRGSEAKYSPIYRALVTWFGLIGMVAAIGVIGFFLSFALLSFFLVYGIERRSLSGAMTVSLVMTVAFFILFRVIMPLPLPLNPWGF